MHAKSACHVASDANCLCTKLILPFNMQRFGEHSASSSRVHAMLQQCLTRPVWALRLVLTAPSNAGTPVQFTPEANVNHPGMDIPQQADGCKAALPDACACAAVCAATAGCNHFAFKAGGPNCKGACWLKYGKISRVVTTLNAL
jgi:hypothetical protein